MERFVHGLNFGVSGIPQNRQQKNTGLEEKAV